MTPGVAVVVGLKTVYEDVTVPRWWSSYDQVPGLAPAIAELAEELNACRRIPHPRRSQGGVKATLAN